MVKAIVVSEPDDKTGDNGVGQIVRRPKGRTTARQAKTRDAEFSRLVDGFDARLQEIEVVRDALLKQLAG